ncbi:MAG: hypothetical protein P4L77_03415 [Sulfuriferula sp.]|nr:hypothetical protein [Sulfuriferula sp.]
MSPASWDKNATYLLYFSLYQALLVVAGFWYGPAICNALIVKTVTAGQLRQTVDSALTELRQRAGRAQVVEVPVILAEYPVSFIVTAGLLPQQSRIFISSAMVERLGINGLRFVLARAMVHGRWPQRMAAMLPVLVLTVMLPDTPADMSDWFGLGGFLLGWLILHWIFELRADYQAAQAIGNEAAQGLRELLAATAKSDGWFAVHPPLRWRWYMVAGR